VGKNGAGWGPGLTQIYERERATSQWAIAGVREWVFAPTTRRLRIFDASKDQPKFCNDYVRDLGARRKTSP
jgi:hypothetical protein